MIIILLFLSFLGISYGGGKVHYLTLKNGVRIILEETHGRGIVSGSIFIKGGTHGEKKRGTTHLMATLLIRGTKSYDAYSIASTFEDWGGSISTSTADDYVEISFSTRPQGFEKALEVIKSILTEPLFSQDDLSREKNNTIVAIRASRERGFDFAMEHLRRITYRGTSYEVSPLGREEDIQNITREDLLERWRELVKGGNVVVSISGDISWDQVRGKLEEAFSSLPAGSYPVDTVNTYIEETKLEKVEREGSQATIMCAFNAVPYNSKDYFAFKVLTSILGDGMNSKLFKELREKKGYAYATFAMYPTRLASPRLIAYIGTSPQKAQDALQDLVKVILHSPIEEGDLQLAKKRMVGDYILDHQTRARRAWYRGFYEVLGLGYKTDDEYVSRIQEVKWEDIKRLRENLGDNYHCVVVQPSKI